MSDKIMFWIDIEFIHYGIAKTMLNKQNFEGYAIIDVNPKAKQFFEKQNEVPFKKKWYYLDNVKINQFAPDKEFLKQFENNYKINLWNLIYSERSFYQFNKYHDFQEDEILSLIEQEIKFFEGVLEEVKPDFMIIKPTDWHHNHLFYEMCRAKGVKVLMMIPTRFGYRWIISERMDRIDKMDEEINDVESIDIMDFMKKHSSFDQANQFKDNFEKFNSEKFLTTIKFFTNISDKGYLNRYSNYKRTKSRVFAKEIGLSIKKRIRKKFIEKKFLKHIPDDRWVFFPMHFEPERTLSIDAPFFTDQFATITNIARALPIEYNLLVKEHPVMKTKGWRNTKYYENILKLPNVRLLHPSVKPEIAYEKSDLVIAITGTAGFESLFYDTPSLVLADVIYSELSSVTKLDKLSNLPNKIKEALSRKIDHAELEMFVKKLAKYSFEANVNKLHTDFSKNCYYGGFLTDLELSKEKTDKFLKNNHESFEILADAHIKKIKRIKDYRN